MTNNLKVGAWKIDITPPLGIPIVGTFDDNHAEEILDKLYTNAIVIDDGANEIVLVSVDVLAIPNDIFNDIIKRIEKICGIDKDNIIIAATHTHSGPMLENIFTGVGEVSKEYVDSFKNNIITSVNIAKKNKQKARIGAGKGKNDKFIFNRRLKKPDGSIIMNFADKDFLRDCTSSGVVDSEILFLVIENKQSKPIAFIVNYANHNNAVFSGKHITSDFSGHMAKTLAKVFGEDVITLFLPGGCGDINWIDYKDHNQGNGIEVAKRIGVSLAGTIMENLDKIEYPNVDKLSVKHKKLYIQDRPFTDEDTKEDLTFGNENSVKKVFEQYRKEKKQAEGKELPINEIDISMLSIGKDIAIITNPGELFTEYGLEMKKNSRYKYTIVSELTNGYAGYVCTPEAFTEGGYETRKTNKSSHLEIEAGNKIVRESLKILRKREKNGYKY